VDADPAEGPALVGTGDGKGGVPPVLMRLMFLSLAAALVTMALKALAALLTGSVGFLSDALESVVNLVAAVVGILALRTAARPADREHHFGHGKAEYLSAAVEGGMIFGASVAIVWSAVERLLEPIPLERPAIGLVLSGVAALVNLVVGTVLIRVGRRHRSPTLVADGKHLMTDVWTSGGVLVGVGAVALFGWERLDPIVALLVGVNILGTGYMLLRRSVMGLLDTALPPEDSAKVKAVIERYCELEHVRFGPIQTREAGRQRFIHLTVRVPGDWSVRRGHDLADRLERDLAAELPGAVTYTHVEPLDG